ncbi:MAG: GNAT family N-acetyltransferase [Lachnospiraceae bacterium]|jgi:N-acetylglutamate synthase-like GNAT family acetyltransferase|nr:GNAT family N-acetyltransferase [Lachnospiraceae bacterium]
MIYMREACRQDVDAIIDLIKKRMKWMDQKGLQQWNTAEYLAIYPKTYFLQHSASFIVAVAEEKIVGAAAVFKQDERWPEGGEALYVHHLVSDPACHGVGAALLEHIEKAAYQQGLAAVRLDCGVNNKALNAYYEAHGYEARGYCEEGSYHGIRREKTRFWLKLRDHAELLQEAAQWFHAKWHIPESAYQESMQECLEGRAAVPQWYVVIEYGKIIAGLGVIENDFHDRKDLAPNVCAVYVEEAYRRQGIAGQMLNLVCADMKEKQVDTLYLLTDHTGFYERYGWEFLCMVQGDGEETPSRMYRHQQQ